MSNPFDLSVEEVTALAHVEREMDAGRQPYVMWAGRRLAVMTEAMEMFQLQIGQTVDDAISLAIMKAHVAIIETRLATEKAKRADIDG